MIKKGKMITCDRCGKTIFLEKIETRDTDGGYAKYDVYENAEGWTHPIGFCDLCPICSDDLEEMKRIFMGKFQDEN